MSFPRVFFAPFGEEQNFFAGTTGGADSLGNYRYEVGQKMLLPDGRVFRAAIVGGSTLAAGNVLQSQAPIANHIGQTIATATAAGSTAVAVTLGATAMDADLYRGGMVSLESGGTGKGWSYPVASHANAAASAAVSIPLQSGSSVKAAINTSDKVSLIASPWRNVIAMPTTFTAPQCGVAVSNATTAGTINATGGNATGTKLGALCWVQTAGLAAVLTNGTVVIGNAVTPSATTAGAVDATSSTFAVVYQNIVGYVARVAATTNWSTIWLTIES